MQDVDFLRGGAPSSESRKKNNIRNPQQLNIRKCYLHYSTYPKNAFFLRSSGSSQFNHSKCSILFSIVFISPIGQIWWPNNLQIFVRSAWISFMEREWGHFCKTAGWPIIDKPQFQTRGLVLLQGVFQISKAHCIDVAPYPSPGRCKRKPKNREKILKGNRVNKCLLEDIMNEQMPSSPSFSTF